MSAVANRTVDAEVIEALNAALEEECQAGPEQIAKALRLAERLGVAPGSSRPEVPAGIGEPAGRRVYVMDPPQVQGAISMAMRASLELERPAPATEPDEVAAWIRANLDETSIEVTYVGADHWRKPCYMHAGGKPVDGELATLLEEWREREADPERGRWLYARVTVTPDGCTAERVYDHQPEWWKGLRVELDRLRAEMNSRAPQWRPSWTKLLEEDLFKEGIPLELAWRPGGPEDRD